VPSIKPGKFMPRASTSSLTGACRRGYARQLEAHNNGGGIHNDPSSSAPPGTGAEELGHMTHLPVSGNG
jgi:hypothetical protein